jgi:hypothetical protein
MLLQGLDPTLVLEAQLLFVMALNVFVPILLYTHTEVAISASRLFTL